MAKVVNWSIDVRAQAVHWSPEVHRIYGTDPAIYKTDIESGLSSYPPEDRSSVEKTVKKALASGDEIRFQKRIIIATNKTVQFETFGLPLYNEAGEATIIFGTLRDIQRLTVNKHATFIMPQTEATNTGAFLANYFNY